MITAGSLYVGLAGLAAGSTPTPAPSSTPQPMPDPNSVSPGALGFLVVFALAVVIWLLMRNLTGRLRRMKFREEQRQAAEAAASGASGGATASDGAAAADEAGAAEAGAGDGSGAGQSRS